MFSKLFFVIFVTIFRLNNCLSLMNEVDNQIHDIIFDLSRNDPQDDVETKEIAYEVAEKRTPIEDHQQVATMTRYSSFKITEKTNTRIPSPNRYIAEPPPHKEVARMARYVVHNSEWCAMATLSTRSNIKGSPFANVFSMSDGATVEESTGIPYFYLTVMEMSVKDLGENNNASITMSLGQGHYCYNKNLDSQDPRCVHIILTGKIVNIEDDSEEAKFAKKALFTRHPEMDSWPANHDWYFAKMDIASIIVLDFFGGPKEVMVEDYFKATPY